MALKIRLRKMSNFPNRCLLEKSTVFTVEFFFVNAKNLISNISEIRRMITTKISGCLEHLHSSNFLNICLLKKFKMADLLGRYLFF